jgi:Tfp pilus assembly protein PilO
MMDRLANLIFALLLTAIVGLTGWSFKTNAQVASMEAREDAIVNALSEMSTDIREIRALMEQMERRK